MARIRSVHPGLWTDEAFVQMSIPARLFLIGLWNEADDFGLLEWKPATLKMRLAPADSIDANAIMAELVEHGFVVKITRPPKVYAVVRNFRVFQRPKNPSAPLVPIDAEIASLIGLDHRNHRQELPKRGGSPTPGIPPSNEINELNGNSYPSHGEAIPEERGGPTEPVPKRGGSPIEKTGQMEGVVGEGKKDLHTPDPTTAREMPFDPPDRSWQQDRFPEFWSAYPRKEGRTKAEAEFVSATIRDDAEPIIAGARRLAAHVAATGQEARYVPLPARWLNDKRWTDDLPQPEAADRGYWTSMGYIPEAAK